MSKIRTGVDVIDKKLEGGFPLPCSLLFFSEDMAEKRIFAENFVSTGIKDGDICIYVDFYRLPQMARKELEKFGPIESGQLIIVDAMSSQLMIPSEEKYYIRRINDIVQIKEVTERAIKENAPKRAVIDSLEFLTDRFTKEEVLDFCKSLMKLAEEKEFCISFIFMNWTYDEADLEKIKRLVDCIVEFKTTLKGGILLNHLRVHENLERSIPKTNWIPFTFKEMLGLVVYFPKILVTGPYRAGKTSLIRSLCPDSISIDRLGTTIAFDHGNVEVSGVEAEVFGTPGQERFEFIFKIFAKEVNGVLLVVDSTKPEEFGRAKEMLAIVGNELPFVVAANKQDLGGALSIEEVRKGMSLQEKTPVIETVAITSQGVTKALEELVELIIWRI